MFTLNVILWSPSTTLGMTLNGKETRVVDSTRTRFAQLSTNPIFKMAGQISIPARGWQEAEPGENGISPYGIFTWE
jgi:hypothetical protein